MAWGGPAGGGLAGGSAVGQSAAAGLPFAGVPAELADRVEAILDAEPEHAEPEVHFTQRESGQRPLTLRNFLAPHRFACWARSPWSRWRPSPSSWGRC